MGFRKLLPTMWKVDTFFQKYFFYTGKLANFGNSANIKRD